MQRSFSGKLKNCVSPHKLKVHENLNIIAGSVLHSILLYSCNKNEFSPEIADQAYTVKANIPGDTLIGIVEASDHDEGQLVSFRAER